MGRQSEDRKSFATKSRQFCWRNHKTPLTNRPKTGAIYMNSTANMSPNEVMKVKLEVLRREHRDLDEAILALQEAVAVDQLTLKRLKKQKLGLKDRIASLEDQLTPDIIA